LAFLGETEASSPSNVTFMAELSLADVNLTSISYATA